MAVMTELKERATNEDVERWWRWLVDETLKELVEEKLEELRAE